MTTDSAWSVSSGPRRKTSASLLVSFGTRFYAWLLNDTNRPSPDADANALVPFACAPDELMLARLVWLVSRSRTKTSSWPLVSMPFDDVLMRTVTPVCRSLTNTSVRALASPPAARVDQRCFLRMSSSVSSLPSVRFPSGSTSQVVGKPRTA